MKKHLLTAFCQHGRLQYFGKDPDLEYNRLMAQLIILIWEYCDVLNIMRVPHSALWPLDIQPWLLSDFEVSSAVSPFRYLPFGFPLLSLLGDRFHTLQLYVLLLL